MKSIEKLDSKKNKNSEEKNGLVEENLDGDKIDFGAQNNDISQEENSKVPTLETPIEEGLEQNSDKIIDEIKS